MKCSRACLVATAVCLAFGSSAESATATIRLDSSYQTIRGFGVSTAWGSSFSSSNDTALLWSTTSGAGLSLHRVRINPTDTSTTELAIAKAAVAHGVTVWATPWTPPAAYKSNDTVVMGNLKVSSMADYAKYLVGFVNKMKRNGVPIYAVSSQNEPDANVSYESCHFSADSMATWVGKYMGPAFAGTGTKVMTPETENWYGFAAFEPKLMADTNVLKYASIVATHEYGGTVKAYPEIQKKGLDFWETEIYDGTAGSEEVGITSGLRVARLIHDALTIANMNAWHYWWTYSDANGGLFHRGTATKRLWSEGNFARFVRPGFVRVGATASPATGIKISAFRDSLGKRLVIVAIDSLPTSVNQTFAISGTATSPTSALPYVTDTSRNLLAQSAVAIANGSFTYALPARSITSFVIDVPTQPSTSVSAQGSAAAELHIARGNGGMLVRLPNRDAGKIEIADLSGRILEERDVPAGSEEIRLEKPTTVGLFVVRLVQGGTVRSARFLEAP